MTNNWTTYNLGDICDDVAMGPFGSNLKVDNFVAQGIPVIRGMNLNDGGFTNNSFAFVTEEKANSLKRCLAYPDDLIFTHRGTLGQVVIIPKIGYEKYLVSQSQMRLSVNKKYLVPKYLYYFFKSPLGQKELLKNSSQVGVPAIANPTKSLKQVEITIPSLEKQQEIASILSSLDDKIEINLQMNQTLESMAQTIFKEWFVNFNFPGFDGQLVSDLPKGWKRQKFKEIIEIKHGYAFKGEFFSDKESDFILLTPGNFKIGGGFNNNKYKYYLGEIPIDYVLKRNDLVVTMTDLSKKADTLGYPALVPVLLGKILLHNQRVGKIIFKTDLPLKLYLYWVMKQPEYRHFVLGSITGSTVKHTSPTRICDYNCIIPDENIISKFDSIAKELMEKEQNNSIENHILLSIRDSLLPKLMSGKIEVKV